MRIAIFIKRTTLHKRFGGLETQNKLLAEGLQRRGHTICVFSPRWELDFNTKIENGVTYYFVDSPYRFSTDSWINASYSAFLEKHKSAPFDVVLSQSSAGIGIIKKKNELNIKVISISHGTILGEFKTRLQSIKSLTSFLNPLFTFRIVKDFGYVMLNFFTRQREFVLNSNRIVAVSNAVKKELINETFVSKDRVQVIFNGVPQDKFVSQVKGNQKDTSKTKILYVGRVVRSKGLFNLITSLNTLYTQDFVLNIVGTGEDIVELKEYVSRSRITNKVNFIGHVDYDAVVKLMQEHDVFVLPSIRVEGFPMVLVEAMLSGLCIIASEIGGIPDAIEDSKTGILVKPGDIALLSEKIALVISDVTLRNTLAANARIKAQKEFSIDVMLDKYEELLRRELAL